MASGIVRASISSLLEEPELLVDTPRNVATREAAKKLLDVVMMDGNLEIFDAFAQKLVKSIQATFPTSTSQLSEKKSERMLSQFHTFRIEKLEQLWKKELYSRLGWVDVPDPILEQRTSQIVFEKLMAGQFCSATVSKKCENVKQLTADEENILRYVAGYVPFKLMKRFEEQSSRQAAEYVECLSHMSVGGEVTDFSTYTMQWLEQVNRGGLFHVSDETYILFRHIELKVRELLPHTLLASAMPFSTALTKDALVCEVVHDEDVQFHWSILSVDIEEDNDPNKLLKYMIELWVTIRAHAFTSSWMQQFKLKNRKCTKKQKGTRKTLQQYEKSSSSKEQ